MTWYAKPKGGYNYDSTEGTSNILEIRDTLYTEYGWTLEAITGAVVNSIYEGGLNPYRWQADKYPPEKSGWGCGIWGFTPYARYLQTDGANYMNKSVTSVTANADPIVGYYQTKLVGDGSWGWVSYGWRPYWDKNKQASEWAEWKRLRAKYGSNDRITLSQYKVINDYHDAVKVFYACFEGSGANSLLKRDTYADAVWRIISGSEPTPPHPTPSKRKKMPLYMMLRRL